jgi:hypothetical protein
MSSRSGLDRLGRTTLRAWGIANLVGWWFVGLVIAYGLDILLSRTFVQKVAHATVGFGWQAITASMLVSVFAAGTAGWTSGAASIARRSS